MKTTFTYSIVRTLLFTFIVAISSFTLIGQTTHNVAVTNYAFTPSALTINVGDKVVWTNNGGSHNVNGTQTTFATNPESFGNDVSTSWTYEYTFNTPGTYNYQCDPHAGMGMVGTVTVSGTTGKDEMAKGSFRLYPNPASEYVELLFSGNEVTSAVMNIYSVNGTLVEQKVLPQRIQSYRYNLDGLKNGLYFMKITAGDKTNVVKFLKK